MIKKKYIYIYVIIISCRTPEQRSDSLDLKEKKDRSKLSSAKAVRRNDVKRPAVPPPRVPSKPVAIGGILQDN